MDEQPDLTKEQMDQIKAEFTLYDRDGDGVITTAELGIVMRACGENLSEAQLQEIIKTFDKDGSGTIDFEEFLEIVVQMRAEDTVSADDVKEAFRQCDTDGDGFITVDELRRIMSQTGANLTDDELTAMIRQADADGDGKVNLEELLNVMTKR